MNEIEIFNYNGQQVREIEIGGNPWWILKDVCDVLGIRQVKDVAGRLEADERGKTVVIDSLGRQQQMYIVNEYGLYNVILRSQRPEAKDFRRWITHEIMPSIRKHGAYMTPSTLETALLSPDNMIKLCTALKQEQSRSLALEAAVTDLESKNMVLVPKANYYDALVDANLLTNFRDCAKELRMKERKFIRELVRLGYIYYDKSGKIRPYANKNHGYFELKDYADDVIVQTLITPKGREKFLRLFQK